VTSKPVGTIAEAIVVGRDALRHVPPDATGRARVVPGLREYAEHVHNLKIDVRKPSPLEIRVLRGMIVRKPGSAIVLVGPELNTCWTRLVVCKEFMHILLDDERSFTTDPVAQLAVFSGGPVTPSAQVNSESYALYAALEYLLPRDHRPKSCDGESVMKVAERFKLPRAYVDYCYGSGFLQVSELVP